MRRFVFGFILAALCAALLTPAHADSLRTTVRAAIEATLTGAAQGSGTPSFSIPASEAVVLRNGTGASQADLIFADTRTIAASSTENLDLAGALADPFGGTLTFVKVKAIYIVASASNTNSVVVGGAGSNTFTGPFADATDKVAIPPGGRLLLLAPVSGWSVTAATGDILLVGNSSSGSGVTYDVVIVGTSA